MSIWTATTDRVARLFGYTRLPSADLVARDVRGQVLAVNRMLYDGTIYQTRQNGGALEDVLGTFVGAGYCNVNRYRLYPYFLPFQEVVDAYQYVIPGTWGDNGIRVADQFDGRPVNEKILAPLARVWRDSNLDSEKQRLIQLAANYGTVGMRVRAVMPDGDRQARVSIQVDDPEKLHNFEEDADGNVVAVCLKYAHKVNRGTLTDPEFEDVEVVEEITKDGYSVRWNDEEQLADADRRNGLGFCPYVILRHKDNGTAYGDWAYKGAEAVVHRINWRVSRQDKSIDRHQFPKWFIAAGGEQPQNDVRMGEDDLTYVELNPDTPTPFVQAIVPQVDQTAAQEFWKELRNMVRGRLPELNLNDMEMVANVSGEALQSFLKPVEKRLGDARPRYLHALRRVQQMALSVGSVIGLWDIGAGKGDGSGDRAYRQGLLDFDYAPMPLLPPTAAQKLAEATAEFAADNARADLAQKEMDLGFSQRRVMQTRGLTDVEAVTEEGRLLVEQADALLNAGDDATAEDGAGDAP